MQRRDICPYYKSGFCTSPMLDTPSDSVTSPNRCFKSYRGCRYYQDTGEEKQGLELYQGVDQEVKFYPKVNVMETPLDSQCEHYRPVRTQRGYVAYCNMLARVLTVSNASMCNKHWQTCPIRTS
ncbi:MULTISPECIES: hypothetical protein [Metallosphaera]|uniref:Uncharacterized protein n=3 Tax=Metallosphaera TaxID=41980 RepID=A4YHG6_METS5|nr:MULTISPECIES: hypothetical protein [Metallosphaera]ABP95868.1 hypothetical protein Msed_1713 [Metallosphaera sedula DSM 5348]AIM27852.1 hypothetical protein HA72_1713 [Metallosphaera sedula]AKV74697.1 hypothetical protein MsedA_1747 [Metallosphaera sedula]AKV76935.1 hypothetical protein MsedB_1749 [Metallosphaera sedula]AKV79186.1 hypothetical protein MsedC_1747 [Metallosphaera sedula]